MRVAVESRPAPHEEAFLFLLAQTCRRLGHEVARFKNSLSGREPDLQICWNAPAFNCPPFLVAELGWLPRWHYQLSHTGINAKHHLAAPALEPLTAAQEIEVKAHLAYCRTGHDCPFPYADPRVPPAKNVPEGGFVLAPLQMPQDTNMENAPEHLRTEQGFIDAVSEMDPPWPVIFKQHPHSGAKYQTALCYRRACPQQGTTPSLEPDRIAPHAEAPIHAYLKSPACRAVVTVNSNCAHDALLWGVPVVALGGGMWGGPNSSGSADWHRLGQPGTMPAPSYIHHLIRAQWRLEDASDLGRVARAIERATA